MRKEDVVTPRPDLRTPGQRQPFARLRPILALALLVSLLSGTFLPTVTPVAAAAFTFDVNSTADEVDANPADNACATAASTCTLRAAIQQANALAAADPANTITINLVAGQNYLLTIKDAFEDESATGDLDIKANVTINGNGATIIGNDYSEEVPGNSSQDRVFHVFATAPDGTTNVNVAINNLTITYGYAYTDFYCCPPPTFSNGGGILNDDFGGEPSNGGPEPLAIGGSLTLTNVTLDENSTGFGGGYGGAGGGIYNGVGRVLTMTNSTVINNAASGGGGLYNAGTATITGSTFSGNVSSSFYGPFAAIGGGGAIGNVGTLTLIGSRLTGNSAFIGGGLSNGNAFEESIPSGAGIAAVPSATVENTDISSNTAIFLGGGIANTVISEQNGGPIPFAVADAVVQVTGGTIANNTASGLAFLDGIGGGGGGVANSGTVALTGVAITSNSAAAYGTGEDSNGVGGGVLNLGALTLDRSALTGNFISGPGFGGAIANGVLERYNGRFGAASGGAQIAAVDTTLTATNVTISGNNAPNGGGALYNVDDSTASLTHVTIANNQTGILNSQEVSEQPTVTAAVVAVQNSILANNADYNCSGTIANGGNNVDSGATCAFGTSANSVSGVDPLLGPLAVNAPGTTATHALLAGSPAIDRVPAAGAGCLPTDQRGVARPQGPGCDSGAYEAPAPTFTVTLTTSGSGTVNPVAGTYTYPAGSTQAFTATPGAGNVFVGWTVDGVFVGFGNPLNLPVTKNRTVQATFAAVPTFCDVNDNTRFVEAIRQLAARGIIFGSDNPAYNPVSNPNAPQKCFRPDDPIIRAETAGLIARAFGWDEEQRVNAFPDRCNPDPAKGCIDDELWNNVAALAFYGVAQGFPTKEFRPYDPVVHAQVISFVTRAFNYIDGDKPDWNTLQVDDPSIYPGVPESTGHRLDIVTYVANAGLIPGTNSTSERYDDPATGYAADASRAFVAEALWRAYFAYYSVNRIP
jgi:large repetitive protein